MRLLLLLLTFSSFVFAQTPAVVQQDLMNFEPGELIVKLKDDVDAGVYYEANGKAMSNFNIGELLGIEEKVASSKVMFHQSSIESSIQNQKRLAAQYAAQAAANPNNGYQPEPPRSMKNVFVITTTNEQENIPMIVEELKNNPNVDYAEPNYIYGIDDFEVGEIITAEQASKMTSSNSSSTIEVDDPLYSSQSNITATNIDDVWDQYTTGDGSQVIAILDTGVDYTHPDLEANIWINEAELNGVEGYDDDGNGYVDDIKGWDFHHQTNTPLDDNMHGTHVAGIAGAVGNNGIGIAGAAWDVKLMPIKVFQASGIGDSATIAQGVEYAFSNGATILNMSFGSYGESYTLKAALENAYGTSILVAAAGNNGICIGPGPFCAPMYPAAYSFVLGVEAEESFSNYDQDGPVYSLYSSFLLNYELKAPGQEIISTIPNGGYSNLTGTSMATPLVSGALSLYNEYNADHTQELMFGNLINTSSDNWVDFYAAMDADPIPDIKILTAAVSDTIPGNTYQDFEPDSGETIHLYPTVKNYWGLSEGVVISLELGGNELQNEYYNSIITITQPETVTGSISAYATYQQLNNPLEFTIEDDVAHNTQIEFILKAWDQNYPDQIHSIDFNLKIKNSIKLQGLIENDTILYADKEYLIDNIVILKHANLIIKPGVVIKFGENEVMGTTGQLQLYTESFTDPDTGQTYNKESKILALGTKDSLITFKRDSYYNGTGQINGYSLGGSNGSTPSGLEGILNLDLNSIPVKLENGTVMAGSLCNYCDFKEGTMARNINLMNSKFQYTSSADAGQGPSLFAYRNNLTDYTNGGNYNSYPMSYGYGYVGMYYNNIANLHSQNSDWVSTTAFGMQWYDQYQQGNNYFNMSKILWTYIDGQGYNSGLWDPVGFQAPSYSGFTEFEGVWIGAGTVEKLEELNIDAFDGSYGVWEYSNPRLTPYEEAHGVVWKILVNNINSFDNYMGMFNNPVSVGSHEFKVYFNREMDTSVSPLISYGVTQPFTQNFIEEEGEWSDDGKIYTVIHEIKIGNGTSDGLNRIRVTQAIDAEDGWEIPKEDLRFNMLIQSAGSLSTGFFAAGGLGKIDLEWVAPSGDELDDVLGYNMYRYQIDEDGNESEPEKLNETLIIEDTDESTTGVYFTDYDVVEGQTYFYKYKILRTSFEETDYSNTVSSSPLTSTLGDSNGDFDVNVLDLVHDVDYILGNNPEPFIFVAGDVNADNTINVLDIVGTVDIILNGDGGDVGGNSMDINFYPSEPIGYADFSWEGNDLYVESMHSIGGLQLAFDADFEYVLHDLPGVERLDYTQDESKVLMLYSFNNTAIASTRTKLLTRLDSTKEIDIDLAVAGTTTGAKLTPRFKGGELDGIDSPFQSNGLEFLKLFPNPSNGDITLEYYLPKNMDGAVAKVYDMVGRLVWIQAIERGEGMQQADLNLNSLQKGNYVVIISAGNNSGEQLINHKLLILK